MALTLALPPLAFELSLFTYKMGILGSETPAEEEIVILTYYCSDLETSQGALSKRARPDMCTTLSWHPASSQKPPVQALLSVRTT